jgi:endoglucanase
MKKLATLLLFICFALSVKSQLDVWPRLKSLKLTEIRTASNNVLVVYFLGPELNGVNTITNKWSLNDKSVGVEKWVTPNWKGIDFGYEHHIYLTLQEPLVQGNKYSLKTPHGDTTFVFNSKSIFCESIKTNQCAYSALSNVRFANFAIWLGTGGSKKIDGKLPDYEVYDIQSKKLVSKGSLTELGENKNSGDFVYKINLSDVPEGGPYKVVVDGFGCSYPFAVGGEYSKRLAYVSFRGLLQERCGLEQKQPYFEHNIRERCHKTVNVTNSPSKEAQVKISATDSVIKTHGGYHDAGDADRRDHHMIAPMALLEYYEMFPEYFSDLQYNIPDKFDADFNPIGQGNGIPDVIDEAEWGTMIYEILQDKNGGVRSGTERNGYPGDSVGLDKDNAIYATFRIDKNSTNMAAGLFTHLARMIKPFRPERALELQKRAESAWAFAGGDSASYAHKLYYYIQYYILTGDENSHRKIIELASAIKIYETKHEGNPRFIPESDVMLGVHFFSYLLQNERPKNTEVVKIFENIIKTVADKRIAELETNFWPIGSSNPFRWWGSQTAQGQYADPIIMYWRLTKQQKYIDAASQLMDYNLGLNPIGKSYLTGIGFDRTEDPLHHDSYPMKSKGWGPAPGILVFGPGNLQQLKAKCPLMIPDIHTVAPQRQYVDSRRNVGANEFTVPESLAYPAVVYTILSKGGVWNKKTNLNTTNIND